MPPIRIAILMGALLSLPTAARAIPQFESPPVHPIDLSADGSTLLVTHLADHRLAVFDVAGPVPVLVNEIPVGLDPVTVRVRTATEAWVVNHLSDTISIVDLTLGSVVRTLQVGDEPTDVVFDAAGQRAFVCVSQEDVLRVWDLGDLSAVPITIPLTGSDPRSLALTPDGQSLWVTVQESGNETTAIHFETVTENGGLPAPTPAMDAGLPAPPQTALIVRHDGQHWVDEIARSWDAEVPYRLYDHDLFRVDLATASVVQTVRGVGTTLFNVGVHPISGDLWVSNQEAINEVRFEPNLQGRFVDNRLTRVSANGSIVQPGSLNPHINYGNPVGSAAERAQSLSIPTDVVVSASRAEVYVAAFGSRKVGAYDLNGSPIRRYDVGLGPAGLALDDATDRLFVYNRIASSVSVVDLTTNAVTELPISFDPTPVGVRQGRDLFYSGENSSAHGDVSCASCHVFGGMDNLAWDLGDPTGAFAPPPAEQAAESDSIFGQPLSGFHPMKGPMTTQSMKGLPGTEALHWRGDRADLAAFNGAFESLLGRSAPLSGSEFQQFEEFINSLQYPPNPFRDLNGALPPTLAGGNPSVGEQAFQSGLIPAPVDCVFCHAPGTGENGVIVPKTILQDDQDFVVPQLRNLYEKTRFDADAAWTVRGFGYFPDGSMDDLFTFFDSRPQFLFDDDQEIRDLAAFMLAWDNGTPSALGAQVTLDGTNHAVGWARLAPMVSQADAGRVGLFAKGVDALGDARGWVYQAGMWQGDRNPEPPRPLSALLADAGPGTEITFTACVAGEQVRLGVDRDADEYFDRTERDLGTDPADPADTPAAVGAPTLDGPVASRLWFSGANPARTESRLSFRMSRVGPVRIDVHDLTGRRVRTLMNQARQPAGRHESVWDLRDSGGRRVSAGVYFVQLESVDGSARKRVVVLR